MDISIETSHMILNLVLSILQLSLYAALPIFMISIFQIGTNFGNIIGVLKASISFTIFLVVASVIVQFFWDKFYILLNIYAIGSVAICTITYIAIIFVPIINKIRGNS